MSLTVQNKRPIVVILGMHRSGTSLISNFLSAIGIEFGQDLAGADKYNEAGYWESLTIRRIQDELLEVLDCDALNPLLYFPPDWQSKPKIQELRNSLLEYVHSECGSKNRIWGFKDPRSSSLLPIWEGIFDQLQLDPIYILAVRNPGSVAASLNRRNQLSYSHSEALWLKSNLDILSHVREKLSVIVDYDRWFDSGLEQAKAVAGSLSPYMSVDETKTTEAFNQVISDQLRHHSSHKDEIHSPLASKLYSLLRKASEDGNIPDQAIEITSTYEKSADLLSTLSGLASGRDDTLAKFNLRIQGLKRQKKLLLYTAAIFAGLFFMSSLWLAGVHNWFK